MIRQFIPSSPVVSVIREELFTFLSNSNNFFPVWRNSEDHAEGITVYYDAERTDICAHLMVMSNKTPLGLPSSGLGTVVFPYRDNNSVFAYVMAGYTTAETSSISRAQFVETECGLFLNFLQSSGTEAWKRRPNLVFLTKNRGFSYQSSGNTSGIDNRGFVFRGDSAVNTGYLGESETVLTCFAPVCGISQTVSNNQLFVTPFTSTPGLPAILDSDIGRFVTDGYFAIPEFYEEVQ